VEVCLIQVPYHAGDDRHGSSKGPSRLVAAGAAGVLMKRGNAVTVELIDRGGPFKDTGASAAQVNRRLAQAVGNAVAAKALPLVLTGSCNSAMGVLAGFEHGNCGAVWIDAHSDFNTPESSISGFFPGMSVAVITGHCYRSYWAQIGDNTPLSEAAVAMFGVRDLSPEAEGQRLSQSAIQVVAWHDGQPQGDVGRTLDQTSGRVKDLYLHIDFDGFTPEVAPGVADKPVPGGLSFDDATMIIRGAADRFRIRAVSLATYNPKRDVNGLTLDLGLKLIDLIGEYAAARA
jgi:arginase